MRDQFDDRLGSALAVIAVLGAAVVVLPLSSHRFPTPTDAAALPDSG